MIWAFFLECAIPKWLPPQPIVGRKGAQYKINGGICLMTQEYPDSMRHVSLGFNIILQLVSTF